MVNPLKVAGAIESQLVHPLSPLPQDAVAISVATDDIITFERVRGLADSWHHSKCSLLASLQRCWNEFGIVEKSSKSVDRVKSGKALGRSLVSGRLLMPTSERLRDLANAIQSFLCMKSTRPDEFACFLGVAQWALLGFRPILSCLGASYGFVRRTDTCGIHIPSRVHKELSMIIGLLSGLVFDLRLPWSGTVFATDGAQCFGVGGVTAHKTHRLQNLRHLLRVCPTSASYSVMRNA